MFGKRLSKKTVYLCTMLFDSIAVSVAISLGIIDGNPLEHLKEKGFLTLISFSQLLAISLLLLTVFFISMNRERNARFVWRDPSILWAILSLGFLFLAIDERYEVHEKIDYIIHHIFSLQETGITDRIDDIVIAFYGLIGLAILYLYRDELKKYRQAFFFIKSGFILLFSMIFLDSLSNRDDILKLLIENGSFVKTIRIWISILEDSLKIFAEGYFLVGFYVILDKAIGLRASQK